MVSGATVIDTALPGSPGGVRHFSPRYLRGPCGRRREGKWCRWLRMPSPEGPNAWRRTGSGRVDLRKRGRLSHWSALCNVLGNWGLTTVVPVPKAGSGGDVIGARLNWATIALSPEQPSAQDPVKQGKSGSTREKGATCPSVMATPTLWELLRPCASLVQGYNEARTGKSFQ